MAYKKKAKKENFPSPFLKWAGGKGRLLTDYSSYFPKKFGTYFEPFLGGGAVFFHLRPGSAFISDSNEELINCYIQVRDNPGELMELMRVHRKNHNKDEKKYFYDIRNQAYESLTGVEKAARTIYLNKTCYNGLYRLNSWGGFNVPLGKYKNPRIFEPKNILAASEILKTIDISVMDYMDIREITKSGDFIYMDPPYHPLSQTSNFTSYTETSFTNNDQENLASLYYQLDNMGCKLMLSNSDTKLIRTLYQGFNTIEIKASRSINSRADRRSAIGELLITNFDSKTNKRRHHVKKKSKYWAPWQKLFHNQVDLTKPVNRVSAGVIKRDTGMEPRLMAKFDTRNDLPPIFRDNGLFLLPVSNGEYVIVKGEGYHNIEEIHGDPEVFQCDLPFELKSAEYGTSEMQHIDFAFNSGLISHFTGVKKLFPTIRGRKFSPRFSFNANGVEIPEVSSVQVEVDAGYEGQGDIILVEAKVGNPGSFNIRQLYYPFRFWGEIGSGKRVRSIFFIYSKEENLYYLYEYRFKNKFNYNSIEPVSLKKYCIQNASPDADLLGYYLRQSGKIEKGERDLHIPQANDIEKIIEFVFRVDEGMVKSREIAKHLNITPRQGNYYGDAARALVLVDRTNKKEYSLTSRGKRFISLPVEKRNRLLCQLMMEMPIIKEVMTKLYKKKSLSRKEIAAVIEANSNLSGGTPERRASTLRSWFWWLYAAVGVVKVGRGRIFI